MQYRIELPAGPFDLAALRSAVQAIDADATVAHHENDDSLHVDGEFSAAELVSALRSAGYHVDAPGSSGCCGGCGCG